MNNKVSAGERHTNNLAINLSIFVITGILFLIIAEFGLRFLLRDVTATADNASYFAKKWHKTFHCNTLGFRQKNIDLAKPAGIYRIAVIGDSLTYGQGIEEKDRFTNLSEKQLNNQDNTKIYEVLNFGRPGAETIDELGFLNGPGLSINPDFILFQWYINDVAGPDDKSNAPHSLILIPKKLRLNSALFYLLHRQFSILQSSLGWVGNDDDYILTRFSDQKIALHLCERRKQ